MTTEAPATRPPTARFDRYEGLVRQYALSNPPLAAGEVLPAIPDEFVAALENADGHDPDAFRQLLADHNIDDAAALLAVLRVVRFYGGTAALTWIGSLPVSRGESLAARPDRVARESAGA
jgi:hypothetical protein